MPTGLKNTPADAVPKSAVVPSIGPRRAINDVFAILFPGNAQAVFKLLSLVLDTTGTGYVAVPTVAFGTGGGGSGAAAVAQLPPPGYGSGVWALEITNQGSGYLYTPTVTIVPAAGDPGAGATAHAVMQPDTSGVGNLVQVRFPPVVVPLGCTVAIRGGNGVRPNAYTAYAANYAEQLAGNQRVQITPDTEISFPCDNLQEIICAGVPGDGLTVTIRGEQLG